MANCTRPPVCSGQLRQNIAIYEEDLSSDEFGGDEVTWVAFKDNVKSKAHQMSAGERFAHQRIQSEATDKFTFRYFPGLKESMKIVFNGVDYNITGIDNWEYRDQWLIVHAKRGVVQ